MIARLRACLELARKNVWGILLVLYPFADQIIAFIEGWMPAMAPHLGPAVFRYMGLVIVVVKVALQVYQGWQQLGSLLAKKGGA